ncbi:hypothetical protein L1987_62699 [Smallanthus sonchifolius]|uniref:Uncharacterized protein n=1 Tax=Smallanthus sonchifolius TaxID=185202 RepID=A0ACB9CB79_9ASTR|nr:hypothetical protein L1987_62699 [Smallanthus sonchifolius]
MVAFMITSFLLVVLIPSVTSVYFNLSKISPQNSNVDIVTEVITAGQSIGLPINKTTLVATSPFVAVEFDTFSNSGWDPYGDHVGISISNLSSVRFQNWFSNVSGGAECHAWITYDSGSKNLSVSFTGFRNNVSFHQDGLYYTVDLRDVLPEWVIFGFSAATGVEFQKNNVKSWAFNSSDLRVDEEKVMPPDPGPGLVVEKTSKVGLIVGLSVTVTVLVVLVFILWRLKKKNNEEDEESGFDIEMNNEFEMGTGPKRFFYHELAQATSGFAEND